MKKATPKKRTPVPAKAHEKKAPPRLAEELFRDVRDLLQRGGYGDAMIEGATMMMADTDRNVLGRVWSFQFLHEGEQYVAAPCMLQTEGWIPKKGERVRFERQPIGVEEQYVFATLLR